MGGGPHAAKIVFSISYGKVSLIFSSLMKPVKPFHPSVSALSTEKKHLKLVLLIS